jgi:site-specific recombinase XerD
LGALRPFGFDAVPDRAFACLPLARERLFIASAHTLTTGIVVGQDSNGHGCSNRAFVNAGLKLTPLSIGSPEVHAHMLRHACGYAMANAGHDTRLIQDWLGHRAIQHTARYTELSPVRFKDVWR